MDNINGTILENDGNYVKISNFNGKINSHNDLLLHRWAPCFIR